jgi:hypothetical protein
LNDTQHNNKKCLTQQNNIPHNDICGVNAPVAVKPIMLNEVMPCRGTMSTEHYMAPPILVKSWHILFLQKETMNVL